MFPLKYIALLMVIVTFIEQEGYGAKKKTPPVRKGCFRTVSTEWGIAGLLTGIVGG